MNQDEVEYRQKMIATLIKNGCRIKDAAQDLGITSKALAGRLLRAHIDMHELRKRYTCIVLVPMHNEDAMNQ
jgi:hypothetical protein